MKSSIKGQVLAAAFAGCAAAGLASSAVAAPVMPSGTFDVNLFAAGSSGTVSDDSSTGAVIYRNPSSNVNVGSGVIHPFLTVQKDGSESGFSTDVANPQLPLDTKRSGGGFTRTFALGDLLSVNEGGTDYYVFFLDINEPASDQQPLLLLNAVSIYLTGASGPFLTGGNTTLAQLDTLLTTSPASRVYSLDTTGADNTILLNYSALGSGSGVGIDMEMLVPTSLFSGALDQRVVFATQFGDSGSKNGTDSGDGFEEWAAYIGQGGACPPGATGTYPDCFPNQGIPEPGSLALLGLGLAGLAALRRRHA